LTNFTSDNTQRLLEVRSECLTKLTESLSQVSDAIHRKANADEVRRIAEDKVDMTFFKTSLQ